MHVTTEKLATFTLDFNRLIVGASRDYEAERLSKDQSLYHGWRSVFDAGFRAGYKGRRDLPEAEADFAAECRRFPGDWERLFSDGFAAGEKAAQGVDDAS